MQLQRRPCYVLIVTAMFLLTAMVVTGVAVNQDKTPDFAAPSDDIDVFNYTYNHSGGTLHNITRFQFNYTGDSTGDVANVTVFTDQHGLYGFNATPGAWAASGGGFLFNVTNRSNTVDNFPTDLANFTVNITLASDAANNSVVDLTLVDNDTTNMKFWQGALPFAPEGNTTVDAVAPRVPTIHEPVDDANISSDSVLMNATVRDSGSGIDTVRFNVTNSSGEQAVETASNPGSNFWNASLDATTLADGDYNITVDANDSVANVNDTEFVSVTLDSTNPAVENITTPLEDETATGTVNLNTTINKALETAGVDTVQFNVTNSSGQQAFKTAENFFTATDFWNATLDTTTLADGVYNVTVRANDSAGNVNNTRTGDYLFRNFSIDNTQPTINYTAPTPPSGAVNKTNWIFQNTSASTDTDQVNFTVHVANGSVLSILNTTGSDKDLYSANFTNLPEGNHSINATAQKTGLIGDITDSGTDTGTTETRHVTLDFRGPNVTVHTPQDDANITGTITVNVTANDPGSGVSLLQYQWINNTGDNVTAWTGFFDSAATFQTDTFDTSTLSSGDGTYNLSFRANDSNGNLNTSVNASFLHVDNAAPNSTDDVNLTQANISNSSTTSQFDVIDRVLQDTTTGVNWSGYTPSIELVDPSSGTGVREFEVWTQNRTFNRETADLDGWTNWRRVADDINESINAANHTAFTLQDNTLYNFTLRPVDFTNLSTDSNYVDLALDASPPQLGLQADGGNVTTPFNWTNDTTASISFNITDITGMFNHTGTQGGNAVNVTYWNATGSSTTKVFPNFTVSPGTNQSTEYQIDFEDTVTNLDNLTTYNVTVQATDLLGQSADFNWSFKTDYNEPATVTVTEFANSLQTAPNGFRKDNHTVQVRCTEPSGEAQPKEAAAETSNEHHVDWTRLNETASSEPARNLTLAKSGNHTYTFKCRDYAGNVNDSQQIQNLLIDSAAPSVTGDNGTDSMGTDTALSIDIHDEGGESWLNSTNSSLELDGGSGSINSIDWGNKTIVVDLQNMDNDEDYHIDGTLWDNVGHSYTLGRNDVTFETESGSDDSTTESTSGGATLSSSYDLSFTNTPSDAVGISAGGTASFTATLENNGNEKEENIDISLQDPGDLELDSVSDTGFDLGNGSSKDLTVTVAAAGNASGDYTVTLHAESDQFTEASTDVDFTITQEGSPELNVTLSQDTVNMDQGGTATLSTTVENTGNVSAGNVSLSLSAANGITAIFTPSTVTLPAGASETSDVTVSTGANVSVDVYTATVTAASDTVSTEASFQVKVQPTSEEEKEAIASSVNETLSRYEELVEDVEETGNADANQSLQEAETLITQIEEALNRGDYAEAKSLQDDLTETLSATEQSLQAAQQDDGLGVVAWMLIVVGVLAVLSLIGYFVLLPELDLGDTSQSGDGYGGFEAEAETGSSTSFMDRLRKTMDHAKDAAASVFHRDSGGSDEHLSPSEAEVKDELVEKYDVQIED